MSKELPSHQQIFHGLLAGETDQYLKSTRDYLNALAGVFCPWITLTGTLLTAYVYSVEDGQKLMGTLQALGMQNLRMVRETIPGDSYDVVRGTLF